MKGSIDFARARPAAKKYDFVKVLYCIEYIVVRQCRDFIFFLKIFDGSWST
jgi:hypothetical protein